MDSEAVYVRTCPESKKFASAFDSFLKANELRCPPPRITETIEPAHPNWGGHYVYRDWAEFSPDRGDDILLHEPNKGHVFVLASECHYWDFNRSFPLADGCQIWRLLHAPISGSLIRVWRRLSRKENRTHTGDDGGPIARQLQQEFQVARDQRERLTTAGYCMAFGGRGKRSKAFQKKYQGIPVWHPVDPILIDTAIHAFGQMDGGRNLIVNFVWQWAARTPRP